VENTVRGWALAWKVCAGEDDEHDLSLGLGGVMLASSEWAGGLRDHELPVTARNGRRWTRRCASPLTPSAKTFSLTTVSRSISRARTAAVPA